MSEVIAYTDGGCRGNPGGVGAWAFLLIDQRSTRALERAGGHPTTTNNRMEMQAAIEALSALRSPRVRVILRTDSRYLIDCCTKWMPSWKRRGWKRKEGALKNVDLLERLDLLIGRHDVRWEWVAGHSGERGNERVDELANLMMDRIGAGQADARHERRFVW